MLYPLMPSAALVGQSTRVRGRRRGAQPGNHNALKHGIYAAASRVPAALIRAPLDFVAAPSQTNLDLLQAVRTRANCIMSDALDLIEAASPPMFGLGCVAYSLSLRLFARACTLEFQLTRPAKYLMDLAVQSSRLLDWEFRRIPEYPLFVPLTLQNSDANSSRGGPVLTDAQWLLLKDLFVSLHVDLDAKRRYRRHEPLPDDRLILRAILIKLAFGLRWHDLAHWGFVPRLCRTRYRQLYLSGRMSAIYTHLHRHLLAYGDTRLEELVEQGCFKWLPNRICLSAGQRLTWQKFTALLLLQRAQCSQRARARMCDILRRRGGAYLRFPSPGRSRSTQAVIPTAAAVNQHSPKRSSQEQNGRSASFSERGWLSCSKSKPDAIVVAHLA